MNHAQLDDELRADAGRDDTATHEAAPEADHSDLLIPEEEDLTSRHYFSL